MHSLLSSEYRAQCKPQAEESFHANENINLKKVLDWTIAAEHFRPSKIYQIPKFQKKKKRRNLCAHFRDNVTRF